MVEPHEKKGSCDVYSIINKTRPQNKVNDYALVGTKQACKRNTQTLILSLDENKTKNITKLFYFFGNLE